VSIEDGSAYGEPRFAEPPAPAAGPRYAVQEPLYGQPVPTPDYASWLQRVGAYLVDGVVTALPALVLLFIGVAVGGTVGAVLALAGYAAGIAVFFWNTVFRQGRTGQSIGKEQVGIRLIRERDGKPVGPGLSFVRQLAHVLDSVFFDIGFLWPLWDAKRQTFADKVCATVVVRSRG
jgi:uncharacterized RDD family membrane protein YckC